MKKLFKTQLTGVMVFLLTVALFASCKKKNDDMPSNEKYPLTNLELKLISQRPSGSGGLFVAYDVKNISNKDYILRDYIYNHIEVRVTIFATDGNSYSDDYALLDLLAGKTESNEFVVDATAGKAIDMSKTKLEFVYKTP